MLPAVNACMPCHTDSPLPPSHAQDWCACHVGWAQGSPSTSRCFDEVFSKVLVPPAQATGRTMCEQAGWVQEPLAAFPSTGAHAWERGDVQKAGITCCLPAWLAGCLAGG